IGPATLTALFTLGGIKTSLQHERRQKLQRPLPHQPLLTWRSRARALARSSFCLRSSAVSSLGFSFGPHATVSLIAYLRASAPSSPYRGSSTSSRGFLLSPLYRTVVSSLDSSLHAGMRSCSRPM